MAHNYQEPVNNEDTFTCDACDKKFKTLHNLRTHTRLHTNPIQCQYCDKQFSHVSSNYRIHLAKHTGELNHRCEICNINVISKTALTIHMLKTHPETIKKMSDVAYYSSLPAEYRRFTHMNGLNMLFEAAQHVANQ